MIEESRYGLKFDLRLLIKKYCAKCGSNLKIVFRTQVHYEIYGILIKTREKNVFKVGLYHCEKCKYDITYKNQKQISTVQKNSGKIILDNASKYINDLKFKEYSNKREVSKK